MNFAGWRGWILAGLALAVYVIGGFGVLAGMVLIGIVGERDLWGLGTASSFGYLLFGVGLGLTILGVMIMRVMRNRGFS